MQFQETTKTKQREILKRYDDLKSLNLHIVGFLKRGDVLLNVEGVDLVGLSAAEAQEAISEATSRLSVSRIFNIHSKDESETN